MSKVFRMLMSGSNPNNLNVLFCGYEKPEQSMLETNNNFYVIEYGKMFEEEPPENVHRLKGNRIPTSIGFDMIIVQDFLEQTLKIQSSIGKNLKIPIIRIYNNSPPENITPQENFIFSEFSGDVCVFFDIINYQKWVINKSSTAEIVTEKTKDVWNRIFQDANKE